MATRVSIHALRFLTLAGLLGACASVASAEVPSREADVLVYGCTSAGVVAAVQVVRMDRSVLLVCPEDRLGGLSASGLGFTDLGDKRAIGGVAREFYQRLKTHYDRPEAWVWESAEDFASHRSWRDAMWLFEPRVAEAVFEEMLREAGIEALRGRWLDRRNGVEKSGARVVSIATLGGERFRARIFIDASYEGDLMAAAGVSYRVGRESNRVYDETLNGVQTARATGHQFAQPVSPFRVPGDPASGLLPGIRAELTEADGEGDHRIQAYNFRLCLTDVPENRIPIERPARYDAAQYELLARHLGTGWNDVFKKFSRLPNRKTDTNNFGPVSTDYIGGSHAYPEASYAERRAIVQEHRDYQQGLLWFLANDPRVPAGIREEAARWGLPRDEFTETEHWPHQLYVREARRMLGELVMTEHHVRGDEPVPEPIGVGSYTIDSHHVQRYVDAAGNVRNEGDVQVHPGGAYSIGYGAIVPRREDATNLLVPVAASASHIAYGSIRMEPVFMILGQSAATAASLALASGAEAVQDIDYATLAERLTADGQVLRLSRPLLGRLRHRVLALALVAALAAVVFVLVQTSRRAAGPPSPDVPG